MHTGEVAQSGESTSSQQLPTEDIIMASPAEHTDYGTGQDKLDEDTQKKSCCARHIEFSKIEYLTVLFMFAYVLTKNTTTTLILDKVCLTHFGYSEDFCNNLTAEVNNSAIKDSITQVATNYQLGCSLMQNIPATLLSLFIGPWSDKYGRQLPMVLGLVGLTIGTFATGVCAYVLNSRVEYMFIPLAFSGIFGGTISLLTLVYSYASDTTTIRWRTVKFSLIELYKGMATGLGSAAGGWLYALCGYEAVFFLSACIFFLALVWAMFMITETRGKDNFDPLKIKAKELFRCETLKESFIATARPRPNKGRKQILLLIVSMSFIAIGVGSTGDINYLYAHYMFGWGNTTFSTISAVYTGISIGILVFVVPLLRYLKTGDVTLGLIGAISLFLQFAVFSWAYKPVIYHIANIVGMLSVCASMASRSRISKIISPDELGKVFLFVAAFESLLPLLTTVLVSQIFNAALSHYPAAPYCMLAGCMFIPLSVFIWMKILPDMNFTVMKDENNQEVKVESIKPE